MRRRCRIYRGISTLLLLAGLHVAGTPLPAGATRPLEPVDTSSPRATLTGFLSRVDRVWGIYRDDYWESPNRELSERVTARLLRLSARITGIILGLTIIFYGANLIGLPVVGVLAGVGVSGLAIALAAQDSLKNLLGSLMICMDQPYTPGQRIVVQGHDGFVENIGLRSTKIRMLDDALTAIPNEKWPAWISRTSAGAILSAARPVSGSPVIRRWRRSRRRSVSSRRCFMTMKGCSRGCHRGYSSANSTPTRCISWCPTGIIHQIAGSPGL
jgi:hypothetical protein